jgi:hypothetical protein
MLFRGGNARMARFGRVGCAGSLAGQLDSTNFHYGAVDRPGQVEGKLVAGAACVIGVPGEQLCERLRRAAWATDN